MDLLKSAPKLIILLAVCPAWFSSFGIADSSNATEGVRFALFWPREASALEAARMFDDIFQPWLKTACPLAARLTKDFVHFSLPNDLDGLINVTQQLAAKPVVLASIMEDRPSAAGTSSWAVKVVKLATATVASSRAADSTLQVHLMSPPDGPTLAELLLRVLRVSLRLPSNHPDRASDRRLGLLLGKPFSLVDLHPVLKAFGGRVFVQSLDDRVGSSGETEEAAAAAFMALEKLERQGVRDLLVVANRRAAQRLLRLSIKTPSSRPVYRWLVFNGDMTDSSSGTQWPNPSLNVTTVEYQKPRTELLKRVLSNRTDSLLLYDQMSLWANAWPICTAPIIERLNWRFDIYRGLLVEAELVGYQQNGQFNLSEPIERTGSRAEVLG
uniref:ANF_receptor domain-containing protein n=1 Tax=Macrostomum lignano TaxID=282301 RepID=A0A1I8IWX3_9PLAT